MRAKLLQSCPTLCSPIDCSPPGSSVHGILQARILRRVAISSSRGSSRPRDHTWVSYISCIGRKVFYHWCHWGSPIHTHTDTHTPTYIFMLLFRSLSRVRLTATPQTAARQSSLAFPVSRSSLKLMSIGLVMPSNHLFLCYPLLFPPSIFLSIRVFSNEWALCIRRPKYWSFEYYESMNVYIFVEEYVSPLWKPLVAILYNIEWEYTQTW